MRAEFKQEQGSYISMKINEHRMTFQQKGNCKYHLFLVFGCILSILSSCKNENTNTPPSVTNLNLPEGAQSCDGAVWGIPFLVYFHPDGFQIPGKKDCQQELTLVQQELDPLNPQSSLSRLNSAQDTFHVGAITDEQFPYPNLELCLSVAQQQYALSRGFYNPTVRRVEEYWKTHTLDKNPEGKEAKILLDKYSGMEFYRKIVDPPTSMQYFRKLKAGLQLELQDIGTAKCFFDLVSYLREKGAHQFGIRIGALQGGQGLDSLPKSWWPNYKIAFDDTVKNLSFKMHTGIIAEWNKNIQQQYFNREAINPKTALPVQNAHLQIFVFNVDPFQAITWARAMYNMGAELAYSTAIQNNISVLIFYGEKKDQQLSTGVMKEIAHME